MSISALKNAKSMDRIYDRTLMFNDISNLEFTCLGLVVSRQEFANKKFRPFVRHSSFTQSVFGEYAPGKAQHEGCKGVSNRILSRGRLD